MSDNSNTNLNDPITPEVLPANTADVPPASRRQRQPGGVGTFTTAAISYSGEIPPPWMLKEFEEICPGFTERLLIRVETQSTHRQKMESAVILGNIVNIRLASVLGTVLGLAVIVLAGYMAKLGLSGYAIALVLGEIAAIAAVAFNRNAAKSKERIDKDENKIANKQNQINPPDYSDDKKPAEASEDD